MKTKLNINQKLSAIQAEFKSAKSRYNKFGKYNYRSAEDILEGLKPFNALYEVNFTINEGLNTDLGTPVIKAVATVTCNDTGYSLTASAYAGVEKAGGMALPQAYGAASSYAKKYCLGNLLLIDDSADADASNNGAIKKTLTGSTNTPSPAKPKITAENIDKAKKFLANNGKIETLIATYNIAPDILTQLKNG